MILRDEIFSRLEFNISQFAGKDQLIHAFEEVAAQGLGGKVPLVLWDEFDTATTAGAAAGCRAS